MSACRFDQVEEDIFAKQWKYLPGFLGVFQEQEDAFIKLIEGLYPSDSVADKSSRGALRYASLSCPEDDGRW